MTLQLILKMADTDAMLNELKRLKLENEELKKRIRPITFSISEKGAVSISGLGKNSQTLYKSQWEKILDKSDELKRFLQDNDDKLN